jgi:hypothetical protein
MATNNAINSSNPITVPQGGLGVGSFTAYTTLAAGTTNTGNIQEVGTGTSGQVLISNGAGVLPSYQTISSNTFLATLNLTNAQIKALTTTPITIVPAQGAGTVLFVLAVTAKMTYGGTNVFSGGSLGVVLEWNNNAGLSVVQLMTQSAMNSSSSQIYCEPSGSTVGNLSQFDNLPLVIGNKGTAITGNVANNNLFSAYVLYSVVST